MENERKFFIFCTINSHKGRLWVKTTKRAKRMREIEVHIEVETLNLDAAKVDLEMMMVSFISNVI
jgi:hypothetical protein